MKLINSIQQYMEKEMTVYHNYLLKVAYSKLALGKKQWAEDIVQDCYLKALKKQDSYDKNKSQLKTWLTTITSNLCIDFNRKKVNKELRYDNLTSIESSFEEQCCENKLNIRSYLNQLTYKEQCIVRMKFFFNMTAKEIAILLNIKQGNIPVIYKRTLQKLRKILEDHGIKEEHLFS